MTLEDSLHQEEYEIEDTRSLEQKEKKEVKNIFGGTNAGIEIR